MRKILICLCMAFAVLSCASVRRATPIAVEDLKQYPTGQEEQSRPVVPHPKSKAEADAEKYPVKLEPIPEEPTPKSQVSLAQQIIDYARTFTGTPYKLGAAGPQQFDCSHFTAYVFKHFGYTLTAFSQAQFREGREVPSYADLQVGDLVFFGSRGSVRNIGHVGIVVSVNQENGSFNFIHASVSKGVTEDNSNHPYFMMRYIGARRVLPD
ncbi:MAG: C40 family peptidase [Bacteroidales bacterium]|nr:C40 family peptidase [Bacteroidales bacterium]